MKLRVTPTIFFIGAVFLAAIAFFLDKPSKALVVNGITFPKDFQTELIKYATVERPDGLIRDEFASQAAIDATRASKPIPVGSVFVIQAFYGSSLGRLGQQNVHVMVKKNSNERSAWAFAAFNPDGSLEPNMDLETCSQCHSSALIGRDSIFSFALLQSFVLTGKPGFAYCSFPARIPCTSDADFSRR